MANINFLTQAEITQDYLQTLGGLDPETNTDIDGTDWWFNGNALGAILGNIYQELFTINNQNFVQYMVGVQLDLALADLNMPSRFGGYAATGTASLPVVQSGVTTIPYNTVLYSGNTQYFVRQTTVIAQGQLGVIPISSQATGSGQQLNTGSQIFLQSPIGSIANLVVIQMTDGSDIESDAAVLTRILNYKSNPPIAGNNTWYEQSALTQPNITGAYSIAGLSGNNILNLFVLSGNNNVDQILSYPAIMYSRQTQALDLLNVNNYIQSIRLALDTVQVNTTDTYYFNGTIAKGVVTVNVKLTPEYTLATIVNGLTIQQLIQREVRRAFITQPYLGVAETGGNYITLQSIQSSIDIGLNSNNGIYCPCLIDRQVLFNGAASNIPVPNTIQPDNNLFLVYDIAYSQITIGAL